MIRSSNPEFDPSLREARKQAFKAWLSIVDAQHGGRLTEGQLLREMIADGKRAEAWNLVDPQEDLLTKITQPEHTYRGFCYSTLNFQLLTPWGTIVQFGETRGNIIDALIIHAPQVVRFSRLYRASLDVAEALNHIRETSMKQYLNIAIYNIRKAVGDHPTSPGGEFHIIKTARSVGYAFNPDQDYVEFMQKETRLSSRSLMIRHRTAR